MSQSFGEGDLWGQVIRDMEGRWRVGNAIYQVPFVAGDGRRDGALDAYEEALDLVVYLHKLREERRLLRQGLLRAARMANTTTMSHEVVRLVDLFLLADGHRLDEKAALQELLQAEEQEEERNILPMHKCEQEVLKVWPSEEDDADE